jgi:predicted transcriptional regulator
MNQNELYRIQIFTDILEKGLKISKAAKLLGLSPRQVKFVFAGFAG